MNDIEKIINYIESNKLGFASQDFSFKTLTTLKVGGKISLVYFPNDYLTFVDFYFYYLKNFKSKIPLLIIGNGSNVLASDDDYKGIVVCFKEIKSDAKVELSDNYGIVTVGSGCSSKKFAETLKEYSLTGAEAIASIPATMGGIVAMNATCFGFEVGNYIKKCLILDGDKIYWIYKDEMDFLYRSSIFLRNKYIILIIVFEFPLGKQEDIEKRILEIQEIRKNTQPIQNKSAGSTFKNGKDYCAWKVIDEVGLRGYTYNGAQISDLHANFIINKGNASSNDIYELMLYTIKVVKDKLGIDLESEWVVVNF